MLFTTSNSSSVVYVPFARAVAPSPSRKGVLGITITVCTLSFVVFMMYSSVMPAAMDTMTVSSLTWSASLGRTESNTWGFIARNTYLHFSHISPSEETAFTPCFSSSASFAASRSYAYISASDLYAAAIPLIIAPPIFPVPRKPTFIISQAPFYFACPYCDRTLQYAA